MGENNSPLPNNQSTPELCTLNPHLEYYYKPLPENDNHAKAMHIANSQVGFCHQTCNVILPTGVEIRQGGFGTT